jgi:hypothetical protein
MPPVRASGLWLRSLALLLLAGACLLALGCGGGDSDGGRLLSREQAGDLLGTLSQVEQDVSDRNCESASQQVATLDSQVDAIARLDRSLRRSLRASVRRLETLVSDACAPVEEAPTETTPTTPEPGPTGATGDEGDEQQSPEEEQPKEKKPKDENGQGPNGQGPPGQLDEGGGAGLPDESKSDGGSSQP